MSLLDFFRSFSQFLDLGATERCLFWRNEPERTMMLIPRFPRKVLVQFHSSSPNPTSRVSL
uniref:Uncharacterized protein n=1 Tax=Castor canadensis TaxID=51338 RepID=A0A8C0WN59_CASCN